MDDRGGKLLVRGTLATLGVAALGTIVFAALLLSYTNTGLAIGGAVAAWMGVAILVWLRAPLFLAPTIVALPVILVAAIFVFGAFIGSGMQ